MLAVLFSMNMHAQFVRLEKYPTIPVEYEAAFVDQVTNYVSGVVKSLYGQYFGQLSPEGNIYGYGSFYTDMDGEVYGLYRNGDLAFGIKKGADIAKVGTNDHFIAYDLRTGYPIYIMKDNQNTFDEVDKSFKQFFHSNAYMPFFDEDHRFCKEMQEKIMSPWNIFMLSFSYTLQMPGKVVDTGTGTYQDGIIYYPITGERLIPKDYIIQATSQVTNIWAYVVTILIILIAIGSWLYRR